MVPRGGGQHGAASAMFKNVLVKKSVMGSIAHLLQLPGAYFLGTGQLFWASGSAKAVRNSRRRGAGSSGAAARKGKGAASFMEQGDPFGFYDDDDDKRFASGSEAPPAIDDLWTPAGFSTTPRRNKPSSSSRKKKKKRPAATVTPDEAIPAAVAHDDASTSEPGHQHDTANLHPGHVATSKPTKFLETKPSEDLPELEEERHGAPEAASQMRCNGCEDGGGKTNPTTPPSGQQPPPPNSNSGEQKEMPDPDQDPDAAGAESFLLKEKGCCGPSAPPAKPPAQPLLPPQQQPPPPSQVVSSPPVVATQPLLAAPVVQPPHPRVVAAAPSQDLRAMEELHQLRENEKRQAAEAEARAGSAEARAASAEAAATAAATQARDIAAQLQKLQEQQSQGPASLTPEQQRAQEAMFNELTQARKKAEEDSRVAEEARKKAEEDRRVAEEARKKAEKQRLEVEKKAALAQAGGPPTGTTVVPDDTSNSGASVATSSSSSRAGISLGLGSLTKGFRLTDEQKAQKQRDQEEKKRVAADQKMQQDKKTEDDRKSKAARCEDQLQQRIAEPNNYGAILEKETADRNTFRFLPLEIQADLATEYCDSPYMTSNKLAPSAKKFDVAMKVKLRDWAKKKKLTLAMVTNASWENKFNNVRKSKWSWDEIITETEPMFNSQTIAKELSLILNRQYGFQDVCRTEMGKDVVELKYKPLEVPAALKDGKNLREKCEFVYGDRTASDTEDTSKAPVKESQRVAMKCDEALRKNVDYSKPGEIEETKGRLLVFRFLPLEVQSRVATSTNCGSTRSFDLTATGKKKGFEDTLKKALEDWVSDQTNLMNGHERLRLFLQGASVVDKKFAQINEFLTALLDGVHDLENWCRRHALGLEAKLVHQEDKVTSAMEFAKNLEEKCKIVYGEGTAAPEKLTDAVMRDAEMSHTQVLALANEAEAIMKEEAVARLRVFRLLPVEFQAGLKKHCDTPENLDKMLKKAVTALTKNELPDALPGPHYRSDMTYGQMEGALTRGLQSDVAESWCRLRVGAEDFQREPSRDAFLAKMDGAIRVGLNLEDICKRAYGREALEPAAPGDLGARAAECRDLLEDVAEHKATDPEAQARVALFNFLPLKKQADLASSCSSGVSGRLGSGFDHALKEHARTTVAESFDAGAESVGKARAAAGGGLAPILALLEKLLEGGGVQFKNFCRPSVGVGMASAKGRGQIPAASQVALAIDFGKNLEEKCKLVYLGKKALDPALARDLVEQASECNDRLDQELERRHAERDAESTKKAQARLKAFRLLPEETQGLLSRHCTRAAIASGMPVTFDALLRSQLASLGRSVFEMQSGDEPVVSLASKAAPDEVYPKAVEAFVLQMKRDSSGLGEWCGEQLRESPGGHELVFHEEKVEAATRFGRNLQDKCAILYTDKKVRSLASVCDQMLQKAILSGAAEIRKATEWQAVFSYYDMFKRLDVFRFLPLKVQEEIAPHCEQEDLALNNVKATGWDSWRIDWKDPSFGALVFRELQKWVDADWEDFAVSPQVHTTTKGSSKVSSFLPKNRLTGLFPNQYRRPFNSVAQGVETLWARDFFKYFCTKQPTGPTSVNGYDQDKIFAIALTGNNMEEMCEMYYKQKSPADLRPPVAEAPSEKKLRDKSQATLLELRLRLLNLLNFNGPGGSDASSMGGFYDEEYRFFLNENNFLVNYSVPETYFDHQTTPQEG
ncbi:unnamed protein product [Amoebophrya sp. A120]|nr:unnamed protein product [Amoebophrya sp. A120]|eukprot:GSA120T00009871001.1